ncbi:MAG: PIG-L deacetylase family protein [Flexilinea sp.]
MDISEPQNLLVIAPHPDDEVMGSGGLIQKILETGGHVKVVIVTNGDGEYLSPMAIDSIMRPKPIDYINIGFLRQSESRIALSHLGINQENVAFLGYPDGKINTLWISNWTQETPVMGSYSHATKSPYTNTYNLNDTYIGADLYNDLLTLMNDFQPDIIVVPHPADFHPDHRAVSNFARFAAANYRISQGNNTPEILTYLVHYESYPQPRGDYPGKNLLPPKPVANHGENWVTFPLSDDERIKKKDAIIEYHSQNATKSYLHSFVRANEIFYKLPVINLRFAGYVSDVDLEQESQDYLTYLEPSHESVRRLIMPEADLVNWKVVRLGNKVCFGSEIKDDSNKSIDYFIEEKLPNGTNFQFKSPDDIKWSTKKSFGICVNLDESGNPPAIGFSAVTKLNVLSLDRTDWCFISLSEP